LERLLFRRPAPHLKKQPSATATALEPRGGRHGQSFALKAAIGLPWVLVALTACNRTPPPAAAPAPSKTVATQPAPTNAPPAPKPRPKREIGWGEDAPLAIVPQAPARDREAELRRAVESGMRRIDSKHLTLLTDLPADPEIDRLPEAFDLAFPEWCAYFGVDPAKSADWHVTGYLMGDRARFEAVDLIPADVPAFRHGYSRGDEFWLFEQPNPYYRRHLLLHEGTHSFMHTVLGSAGPPWYSEGMAEFLGTHRWDASGLELAYLPKRREEVPELGRIKLMQDGVAARRAYQLEQILQFGPDAHQKNEGYAWCWGLATFLDGHPRYQERFRVLPSMVNSLAFNEDFLKGFRDGFAEMCEEWQVFVSNIEHGYDQSRMVIDFTAGKELPSGGATIEVQADQGWQNTGLKLAAGQSYRLRASGRYQLGTEPVIWWSEPGGVSIRYYHHEPLGKLLAVVRPDGPPRDGRSAFLAPIPIGLEATVTPEVTGTLYLRINDSAGELGDNQGQAEVRVTTEN
jgi:hypothetical protein